MTRACSIRSLSSPWGSRTCPRERAGGVGGREHPGMADDRRDLDRAPIAIQDLRGGPDARAGSLGAIGAHEDPSGAGRCTVRHEDRARRVMQDVHAHTAQQEVPHPGRVRGAEDDEVVGTALDDLQDLQRQITTGGARGSREPALGQVLRGGLGHPVGVEERRIRDGRLRDPIRREEVVRGLGCHGDDSDLRSGSVEERGDQALAFSSRSGPVGCEEDSHVDPFPPQASGSVSSLDRSTRPGSRGGTGQSSALGWFGPATRVLRDGRGPRSHGTFGRSRHEPHRLPFHRVLRNGGRRERRIDAPGNPFSWVLWRWSLDLRVL